MTNLRAGAARVNITPPLGTAIPGYHRVRTAREIDDDLFVRAIVLEDGKVTLALAVCDVICIRGRNVRQSRRLVEDAVGIPADHILIAATHTHTGPATAGLFMVEEDEGYTAWMTEKIADAIRLAQQRLQPARVGTGIGREDRVSFNRRFLMKDGTVRMNPGRANPDAVKPAGPIDPDVGIVYLEAEGGRPLAAVVNFALHYVGTDNSDAISADYFARVENTLRDVKGDPFVALVLNGSCGDINNVDTGDADQPSGARQAQRVAEVVAGEALGVIGTMKLEEEATLGALRETFTFRRKEVTEDDLVRAETILEEGPGAAEGQFGWVSGHPIPEDLLEVYARECRLISRMPDVLESELQALRIGDLALVGLPGEIFVEIGLQIKDTSPFEKTLVVELANDYIGYCPTDRALGEGGYETWAARSALPGAGIEQALTRGAGRLLKGLA